MDIATGGEDMAVSLYNIFETQKPAINQLQGHSAPVLSVAWNPTETFLASGDEQGVVIVWKSATVKHGSA